MNQEIFKTDVARLMVLLLPTPQRQPLMVGMAGEAATPFATILGRIKAWYDDTRHRAQYNGQVCRLAMLLNDKMDEELRGIRVVDGNLITGAAVYARQPGEPTMTPKERGAENGVVIVPSRAASVATKYDFKILVPKRIVPETGTPERTQMERYMAALVNTYKLPSTKWNWQAVE